MVDRVQNSSGSGWDDDHAFGFGFIGFVTLMNFRVYRVLGYEKVTENYSNLTFLGHDFFRNSTYTFNFLQIYIDF